MDKAPARCPVQYRYSSCPVQYQYSHLISVLQSTKAHVCHYGLIANFASRNETFSGVTEFILMISEITNFGVVLRVLFLCQKARGLPAQTTGPSSTDPARRLATAAATSPCQRSSPPR